MSETSTLARPPTGMPGDAQRALLNILEDFAEEREWGAGTQRAVLNILEDFGDERRRIDSTQRAILNILDDFAVEKERLESTQKAVLNILDDFDAEKAKVDAANAELRTEVSERRRAESALEERTRELGRSNDELEMFAYAASHDLSEPLRAIAGPATMLARRYRGALDTDADELIDFITDGCSRMHSLITDLLAYSRVGRLEASRQAVDCNEMLDRVISVLRPTIDETNAKVIVEPLPTVLAEPTQLGEVFQNLLTNAMKFARAGVPPEVTVEAERMAEGWRFFVTDNGIGIHSDHRERVFGMFKRLHARDEYPGTGIGLALVKKIVEHHGGHVAVDDAPSGPGCRLSFTIASKGERP